MIKPVLSGIFAGLLSLSSVSAHAGLTGNQLHGFLKGNDVEKSAALGYVMGTLESLDEALFCLPAGFNGTQGRDIVKQALEERPGVRHMPANLFIMALFEGKFPCKHEEEPEKTPSKDNGKGV